MKDLKQDVLDALHDATNLDNGRVSVPYFTKLLDGILTEQCNIANVVESKPSTKAALNASVSAIYFADGSDYLSYHYEVVRSLTKLDKPSYEDIKMLFKELNPK